MLLALLVIGLTLAAADSAHAQAPQDEVVYIDTDGIGSVRLITDANGNVVERHDFQPFGQETPSPTGSNPLFAGKERDTSGADYSGARYFAAKLGRFTSADAWLNINAAIADPQIWNRFVYARNNPLLFIDPSGFCIVLIDGARIEIDECIITRPGGSEGLLGTVDLSGYDDSAAEYQGPAFDLSLGQGVATGGGYVLTVDGNVRESYAEAAKEATSAVRQDLKELAYSQQTRVGKAVTLAMRESRQGQLLGKTPLELAASAGRTNAGVNAAGAVARVAGPSFLLASAGVSAYNVATAAAGQKGAAVAQEVGVWAGALAGGKMGAEGGFVVGNILGGGPFGGAVGAVIGGLGGAAVGAWGGGNLGRAIYNLF